MPELDAEDRKRLDDGQYAYIDRDGGRHLPINDEGHVRSALGRFTQTDFESKAARERARKRILAAAERYGIDVAPDSEVSSPTS